MISAAIITKNVMAIAVRDQSAILFAKECGIDRRSFTVNFVGNHVEIHSKWVNKAVHLYRSKGKLISRKCWEWKRSEAEIWGKEPEPMPRPLVIPPSDFCNTQSKFIMTNQKTDFLWMGGRIKLTRNLYNAIGEMLDADKPMGLVSAKDSMQLWVNPAAVELFKLPSIEQATPRDTSKDWYAPDLELKRRMIRDAGENPFEISYRTQICDRTWKRLTNRYRLIDNLYLIGSSISSEIIAPPSPINA